MGSINNLEMAKKKPFIALSILALLAHVVCSVDLKTDEKENLEAFS